MAIETERKFLVKGEFKTFAVSYTRIKQGYLSSVPERVVRIRIRDEKAYITVKSVGNGSWMSRYEWEKEIPVEEAEELLKICEPGVVEKTRYLIPAGERTFEVDEFLGENVGLIMAEIELESEDEVFERPDWLGKEVTEDKRYYNVWLAKHPFSTW